MIFEKAKTKGSHVVLCGTMRYPSSQIINDVVRKPITREKLIKKLEFHPRPEYLETLKRNTIQKSGVK